jgi:hypothetical protein
VELTMVETAQQAGVRKARLSSIRPMADVVRL